MEPEKSIDSGYYMIMSNLNRKYVLEADTSNTTIKEVKNTSDQKWHILYTDDGYYTFAWAKDENYYLTLKDGKITLSKKEENKEFRWIIKLVKGKWKDAPVAPAQLEKFLKDRNVEVDSIGTSEKDIDAWMKTIEDCR